MTKRLGPESPHLTVAVYPGQPEDVCFASLCSVVEDAGCRPQGLIDVAPWDRAFEMRSDLADVLDTLEVPGDPSRQVAAARTSEGRPVRAWFVHQINGVVVVEYLPAPLGDRHPIGVSLAARSLGIPEEHWDKGESGAASRLARWTKDLLRNITSKCEAPYGAIGVEIRFATPSQLREGSLHMTSEVFVSRQLLTSHPSLERTLNEDYGQGEALDWPHGTFFSTWAPYNARRVTVSGIQNRLRRSELALGNAMLAHP